MAYPCQTHAGFPKEAEKKPGQINCTAAFKEAFSASATCNKYVTDRLAPDRHTATIIYIKIIMQSIRTLLGFGIAQGKVRLMTTMINLKSAQYAKISRTCQRHRDFRRSICVPYVPLYGFVWILIWLDFHMDSTYESRKYVRLIGTNLHSIAGSRQLEETSGRPMLNCGQPMADDNDGGGSKNGLTSPTWLPLQPFRPNDGSLSRQLRSLCCTLAASGSDFTESSLC